MFDFAHLKAEARYLASSLPGYIEREQNAAIEFLQSFPDALDRDSVELQGYVDIHSYFLKSGEVQAQLLKRIQEPEAVDGVLFTHGMGIKLSLLHYPFLVEAHRLVRELLQPVRLEKLAENAKILSSVMTLEDMQRMIIEEPNFPAPRSRTQLKEAACRELEYLAGLRVVAAINIKALYDARDNGFLTDNKIPGASLMNGFRFGVYMSRYQKDCNTDIRMYA